MTLALGDDLEALLADLGLAVERAEALPHLDVPAHTTRAFRIELTDGTVLKGVEVRHAERAAVIEQALTHLALEAFPRIAGRRGRALLFEWIDGGPVHHGAPSIEAAGTLLAQIHSGSPAGLIAEPRLAIAGVQPRFDARLRTLCNALVATFSTAKRLRPWADTHAPTADDTAVFVHLDLALDNLVDVDGQLRVIDHDSWSTGPAAFDMARMWWRWPMDRDERIAWRASYERAGGDTGWIESFPFWVIAAAIGSTSYRLGGAPELVDRAAARLAALADLAGTSGDDLLLGAIP